METAATPACPVCRASFRGALRCPRCGADLEPVMNLLAAAWSMREGARRALRAGEFARARRLAEGAADLHATGTARDLALLAAICAGAEGLAGGAPAGRQEAPLPNSHRIRTHA